MPHGDARLIAHCDTAPRRAMGRVRTVESSAALKVVMRAGWHRTVVPSSIRGNASWAMLVLPYSCALRQSLLWTRSAFPEPILDTLTAWGFRSASPLRFAGRHLRLRACTRRGLGLANAPPVAPPGAGAVGRLRCIHSPLDNPQMAASLLNTDTLRTRTS
jgi:hypothetical protein